MANIVKRKDLSFQGFRRENGRVGVRNHVIILPLDDLSNAACEAVANNIKGTLVEILDERHDVLDSLVMFLNN